MPIHVTIQVNERTVQQLHIARIDSALDRNPAKAHTYTVIDNPVVPEKDADWDDGVNFEHVYGDGVTVCVKKALAALSI